MNTYDVGDRATLSVTFAVDSVATDPSTIVCTVKAPNGTVTTKTYGVGTELVKDGTGAYHLDVDITASGRWHYRWAGTGAAQGAEEASFVVRPSQV
jgi:hypothetical protein